MRHSKQWIGVVILVWTVAVFGAWKPGSGPQISASQEEWTGLKQDLLSAKLDSKPYALSKRSTACDFDLRIRTPFAKAAAFAQRSKDNPDLLTFEAVQTSLSTGVLTVEMVTLARGRDQAQAAGLVVVTDKGTAEPMQESLIRTHLRSVGFYAEPFYEVVKVFSFDMDALKDAKFLTLRILESEDKSLDLKVNLGKLR